MLLLFTGNMISNNFQTTRLIFATVLKIDFSSKKLLQCVISNSM